MKGLELPEPREMLEALENVEEAESKLMRAQIDYPYSDLDVDECRVNLEAALGEYLARCWG